MPLQGCPVGIKNWSAARIPWPRDVLVGKRGHPSHLVDEELTRAIVTEAAVDICYRLGVSEGVVR
jgi:hypothetical protein